MQIWSEVTQQNCHHRCQSLWPWSTETENLLREAVPSFVSGWQTHKQPPLGYCHSNYLRQMCHPENVNPAAMSLSTSATLKFFDSQFGALATCPPSADMGITAILSAPSIIVHFFKSFSITWDVCWIAYCVAIPPFNPCHQWTHHTPKLDELKSKERKETFSCLHYRDKLGEMGGTL